MFGKFRHEGYFKANFDSIILNVCAWQGGKKK